MAKEKKKKKKNQRVEARITIDGLTAVARPNQVCSGMDALLEQHGANSFVFIPLARLDKKGQKRTKNSKRVARRKAKLPEHTWYDGELIDLDDGRSVPGVLAFDVRRRAARTIAKDLKLQQFMWGTTGAPIESHNVKLFEEDNDNTWKTSRAEAFVGLTDMWDTIRRTPSLQVAVEESQTSLDKFWRLAAVVIVAALVAGAIKAVTVAVLDESSSLSWVPVVMNVVFYPCVIPAFIVGIYLRVLMRRGEAQARDFTAGEAAENWKTVAPHLLALWAVCWVAVLILTWLQNVPSTEMGVLGRTDGVTISFIVCVWMLLPIAHSRGIDSTFNAAIEAAVSAGVSILIIKISIYVTNLISDAVLGFLANFLPFLFPVWLQDFISTVVNYGAEVFFFFLLLGFAWSRTRQQFMRL
ncbi:MAG: hypothetical protein AAF351_09910 [Pseudomonadota bacterium]